MLLFFNIRKMFILKKYWKKCKIKLYVSSLVQKQTFKKFNLMPATKKLVREVIKIKNETER